MYCSALARSRRLARGHEPPTGCSPCSGGRPATMACCRSGVQTPTLKPRGGPRPRDRGLHCPCRTGPSTSSVRRRSDVHRAVGGTDASTDDAGRCLRQPSHSRPRSRSAPRAVPRWCRSRPSACAKARRCCSTWAPSGSLFQAAWAGRAGNLGDRPGPVQRRHKATTYPRSDSGLPARKHVRRSAHGPWTACSKTDPTLARSWASSTAPALARLERRQVTAHHGIIPTLRTANLSAMSEKERRCTG